MENPSSLLGNIFQHQLENTSHLNEMFAENFLFCISPVLFLRDDDIFKKKILCKIRLQKTSLLKFCVKPWMWTRAVCY